MAEQEPPFISEEGPQSHKEMEFTHNGNILRLGLQSDLYVVSWKSVVSSAEFVQVLGKFGINPDTESMVF